jgi:hypothetical protein
LAVLSLIAVAGIGAYVLINGSSSTSNTAGTQATLPKTKSTRTTAKKSSGPEKSTRKTSPVGINALDAALVSHPLVVVSVYAPDVVTDTQAMKEARAGAASAEVGFVAFNIFNEKIARQLSTLVGGNETANPEVLFFKRGRTLVFRLKGFADSRVVAQAARNVYPHIEPWVSDANMVCRRYTAPLATANAKSKNVDEKTAAGRKQAAVALDEVAAVLNKEAKSLSAVRPNVSAAKDYGQFVSVLKQLAATMISEAAALRRNDLASATTSLNAGVALVKTWSSLAANLQITACAP